MRTIPENIQTALDSGAAKHCYCWHVELTNGTILGFTNHDKIISFDGVDYEPESGFTPSEVQTSLGLAIQTQDVEGALNSDRITNDDLRAGLWDNAVVTVWLVDWETIVDRFRLHQGSVGQVRNGEHGFAAEVRGKTHELNQAGGRFYTHGCDAKLGDNKCQVNLNDDKFHGVGIVEKAEGDLYVYPINLETVSGNARRELFSHGTITFTSGENSGLSFGIRQHVGSGSEAHLVLDNAAHFPIQAGDTFIATIGCDKKPKTCHRFFDNMINYRGFNLIPGNDRVSRSVKKNGNDGSSLFGKSSSRADNKSTSNSSDGFFDTITSKLTNL